MKNQKGFTLIELMIVVAIIGILAAIAIPAYQDYTTRAKVSEGLTAMGPVKASIAEFYMSTNDMPTNANQAGINVGSLGDYVVGLEYQRDSQTQATVAVEMDDTALTGVEAGNEHFSFVGSGGTAGVTWECRPGDESGESSNAILNKFLPANCRGT